MSFNHDSITKKLRKLTKKQLQKRDVFGRTILHLICITGRFELLKVLLQNPNLNVTITDHENGWTGLHTAIYYGKFSCAKILLDFNYDLVRLKDRNSLTALDIYHLKYSYKDLNIFPDFMNQDNTLHYEKRFKENVPIHQNLQWWDANSRGGSEVYTFGVNVNNNLGTGDSVDKSKFPVNVEVPNFRIHDMSLSVVDRLIKPRIKDIKLSRNHSVLLTNEPKNNILMCGNPSRGRLGSNSNAPMYRFNSIDTFQNEVIVEVAVSDDHSLALTSKGEVYSWGLNVYGQLGYSTEKTKDKMMDTFSSEPRKITHTAFKKLRVKGVACSKIHNVAYSNTDLIIWGLNIGQMDIISSGESVKFGKFKGIVQPPRKLEFQSSIKQVITNSNSTIILLQNNECHVLINGNHLKIPLPQYRALNNEFEKFRPTTFSRRREIVKICSRDHKNIAILYDDGSVWDFGVDPVTTKNVNNVKFLEIWKPKNNHLKCVDVDIGTDGSVVICTKSGCVFKRESRYGESKKGYKFNKIPKISKVVKVSCDELFTSFGFIRDDVDQIPLTLKKNSFKRDIGRLSPLYLNFKSQSVDAESDEYVIDYLHQNPKRLTEDDDDEQVLSFLQNRFTAEEQQETEAVSDPLLNSYKSRWNAKQPIKSTFSLPFDDSKNLLSSLSSNDFELNYSINNYNAGKNYNIVLQVGEFSVGCHDSVLKFDDQLYRLHSEDLVIADDIKFHKLNEGVIKVEGVDLRSMLVILHVFYTGELLKPWEGTSEFKNVQSTVLKVLKKLQILDDLNRLSFDLSATFENFGHNFENDLTVRLANYESIECCSFVLSARNEYFRTLLSSRWGSVKEIEFMECDKEVFQLILNYIYGGEQLALFDHLQFDSVNDFVNYIFNLIEIIDGLLMFEFKDFLQLTVKDFINVDNVLTILQNAEILNCQKITNQCLYFIYHNFDLVLMDPQYDEEILSTKTFASIDDYAHMFNKMNQFSTITSIPWFEDNQLLLISQFLNDDLREFNDIFLEHDNFVPLFDIKPAPINLSPRLEPTTKAKYERVSSIPSVSPLTEQATKERKSSVASLEVRRPSYSSLVRNGSVGNDSAIEFVDDDSDFQPVINSRRRKSSAHRRNSNNNGSTANVTNVLNTNTARLSSVTPTLKISSTQLNPTSSRTSSLYSTQNQSSSSIVNDRDNTFWPDFNSSSKPITASSSSSVPWVIPSSSSLPKPAASMPVEYATSPNSVASGASSSNNKWWNEPISQSLQQQDSTPSNSSSAKITINRISQRERKKLTKTNDQQEAKKKSKIPWKLTSLKPTTSALSPSSSQPSLLEIARLELLQEQKNSAKNATPSLKGIMHEEEHKIIFETERKSLAEIQQEEEFNLWWEAESKKVQTQVNPPVPVNNNNGGGKNNKDSCKTKKTFFQKKKSVDGGNSRNKSDQQGSNGIKPNSNGNGHSNGKAHNNNKQRKKSVVQ